MTEQIVRELVDGVWVTRPADIGGGGGGGDGMFPNGAVDAAWNGDPVTAQANQLVSVDANGGAVTVTLPSDPPQGSVVGVQLVTDPNGNTVTVDGNGDAIQGSSTYDLPSLAQYETVLFTYATGITEAWTVFVKPANGGSQPFRVVTLDVAFDTPGLIIPASGPAGIKLTDVVDFEALVGGAASDVLFPMLVFTEWDGSTPQINLTTTAGRGNLPGTPPTPFQTMTLDSPDVDDSSSGAFQSAANVGAKALFYFTPATSLYAYVDDGAGADPESAQGSGRIVLLLMTQ